MMVLRLQFNQVWEDYSHLILDRSIKLDSVAYSADFRPVEDELRMELAYDNALALKLLQATDRIPCEVTLNAAPYFTGYVSPSTEISVKKPEGTIELVIRDNSYLLDKPFPQRYLYQNTNLQAAVQQIASIAGVSIDSSAPDLSHISLPYMVFDEGENIRSTLVDLLYYNGFTLFFTPGGAMSWRPWFFTSLPPPSFVFDDSNAHNLFDQVGLRRETEVLNKNGVEVEFDELLVVYNAQVAYKHYGQPTTNWHSPRKENLTLSLPYQTFRILKVLDLVVGGESYDIDAWGPLRWVGAQHQPFRFSTVGSVGAGFRLSKLSLNNDSTAVEVELTVDNAGHYATGLHYLWVKCSAIVEVKGRKVVSDNAGGDLVKIRSQNIYSADVAKDFANAYYRNVVSNPFEVAVSSYTSVPVGDFVSVDTSVGGFSLTGVITQKTYYDSEKIYRYVIRAIGSISSASNTTAPQIPTPPSDGIIIVGTNLAGDTPSVVLKPDAPSQFTKGLTVTAEGVTLLDARVGLRKTSTPTPFWNSLNTYAPKSSVGDYRGVAATETMVAVVFSKRVMLLRISPSGAYSVSHISSVGGPNGSYTSFHGGGGIDGKLWIVASNDPITEIYIFHVDSPSTGFTHNLGGATGVIVRPPTGGFLPIVHTSSNFVYLSLFDPSVPTVTNHGILNVLPLAGLEARLFLGFIQGNEWIYGIDNPAAGSSTIYHHDLQTHATVQSYPAPLINSKVGNRFWAFNGIIATQDDTTVSLKVTPELQLATLSPNIKQPVPLLGEFVGVQASNTNGNISLGLYSSPSLEQSFSHIRTFSSSIPYSFVKNILPLIPIRTRGINAILCGFIYEFIVPLPPYTLSVAVQVYYVDMTEIIVGGEIWPAGIIMAYGGTTIPPGWLLCDGQEVSRSQFPRLFAAIGTTWGAGDGVTTFNVPNLMGAFLRGAGGQSKDGVSYSGAPLGGYQHGSALSNVQNDGSGVHQGNLEATYTVTTRWPLATSGTGGQPVGRVRPFNYSVNYIIKT